MMDFLSPHTIKSLLKAHCARPSKRMGQNFLIDKLALDAVIVSARLSPQDIVLEAGPGVGTLTRELAHCVKKVIAVEKDRAMVEILEDTLSGFRNIEIIHGDILRYQPPAAPYKIVANIPYYLTSALIRKFLEADSKPAAMVLMVQKEVAQRICAQPPNMSLLAVSVQFYAETKIASHVPRACFWPLPEVDSAIITLSHIRKRPDVDVGRFFAVVKAGFSQPRKQLANNLARGLKKERSEIAEWLSKNNLNPSQRAETLSIEDWIGLCRTMGAVIRPVRKSNRFD